MCIIIPSQMNIKYYALNGLSFVIGKIEYLFRY